MSTLESFLGKYMSEHPTSEKEALEFPMPRRDAIIEEMNKRANEIAEEMDLRIEFALRHLVTPVVKGPITQGKLRWRGIKMCAANSIDAYFEGACTSGGSRLQYVGRPLIDPNKEWTWSIEYYLYQRKNIIPLNFTGEMETKYQGWLIARDVDKTIVFGINGRRDGKYIQSGLVHQIREEELKSRKEDFDLKKAVEMFFN